MEFKEEVRKTEKVVLNHKNIVLMALSFVLSYLILTNSSLLFFIKKFEGIGYIGAFIVGIFFSYGITIAPALSSLIIIAKELNPLYVAMLGALGAIISDYIIFSYIKKGMIKEIKNLSNEFNIHPKFNKVFLKYTKKIAPYFAGVILASPFPTDELAAAIFSSANISKRKFMLIAFTAKFIGLSLIFGLMKTVF